MVSTNDILEFLHSLQDDIAGLLQWLQKYKAGYLVVVVIAARMTWRIYKSVSWRRENEMRAPVPTQSGHAAFGAVQEIVQILDADPDTDWSKVNLAALREHFINMDEVMLRATLKEESIDNGLSVEVSGTHRTLAAIRRIVPALAEALSKFPRWNARAETVANGVIHTVTSTDSKQRTHIRALGFIGLLASGSHHGAHHVALVKPG
jgi:hypothetical protein